MPSAALIEADVAYPSFQVRIWTGAAYVDVTDDVLEVSGDYTATSSPGDGNGFGLAPTPRQTIRFSKERYGLNWDRSPVEIRLGFGGYHPVHFVGLIDEMEQDGVSGTWTAQGYQALLSETPEIRSPLLYRRPIFTATTATSGENPDNAGWGGGLGNLILWRAGGRPYQQAVTYPEAVFYYSCETAILAPEWSWINGGDPAQALDDLCRAAGGIVYQDTAGTVRYQEPMTFAYGATAIHYTDGAGALTGAQRVAGGLAQYGTIRRTVKTRKHVVDIVRCPYVRRRLQGHQEIYKDQTPRLVEAGATLSVDLDLQLPAYSVHGVTASGATLRSARTTTTAELTVTIASRSAQRITVSLHNTLSEPVGVYQIAATGQPLVAGEEGEASYGSAVGSYPRAAAIPSSVYIQSESYARRMCHLEWDFRHEVRPIVELGGCGYDPRRTLGEIVLLTSADLGISAERHRVVGIKPGRTGVSMDLTLVSVAGLPVSSDFFINDTAFSSGGTQLIY